MMALGGGHVCPAGRIQAGGKVCDPEGRSRAEAQGEHESRGPSANSEGKGGKEQMGKRRSKAENDKRASGCVRRSWEESKMEKEL